MLDNHKSYGLDELGYGRTNVADVKAKPWMYKFFDNDPLH